MDCHISVQMEGMIEEMETQEACIIRYLFSNIEALVGSLYMVFLKV